MSTRLIRQILIMMTFIEEKRGTIQKLVKFISELLNKLSSWLQPRRR